jgi:hypothetical protein
MSNDTPKEPQDAFKPERTEEERYDRWNSPARGIRIISNPPGYDGPLKPGMTLGDLDALNLPDPPDPTEEPT